MAKTWSAPKDPDEIRDFGVNWAPDIGDQTIASSVWTVTVGDVVIDDDSKTDTTTTVRLSGGTLGETCELLNHIVLDNGEEPELTCKLKIRAK
jgi:hypothetical protein